jgi:hypothetical protein
MDSHIFEAMIRLGKEKVESVLGGWQMAVHAIHYNAGSVVGMGAGSPCHNGRLDFMTGCTKLGCGGSDHGVIGKAEKRKCNEHPETYQGGSNYDFFHFTSSCVSWQGGVCDLDKPPQQAQSHGLVRGRFNGCGSI